jgi:hypothetical protein
MLLLGIVEVAFGCVCRPGVALVGQLAAMPGSADGHAWLYRQPAWPDQPCFAHTDHHARAAALGRLRRGGPLDFVPGVELTEELLAEVVAAAPTGDGRRVLRDADLQGLGNEPACRFHGLVMPSSGRTRVASRPRLGCSSTTTSTPSCAGRFERP